jgi:hypothetical protein
MVGHQRNLHCHEQQQCEYLLMHQEQLRPLQLRQLQFSYFEVL